MNASFRDIEKQVAQLRAQRLPHDQFEAAVNQLRVIDDDGATWQISAETGSWIKWDGANWLPANPFGDDFDTAGEHFVALQTGFKAGQIDFATFTARVEQIRVETPEGETWAILPQNGAWVRWTGTQWVEQEPPRKDAEQPSEFAECEAKYHELLASLQAGGITQEDFEDRVTRIRITDENGASWQLSPENGSWLKWDGLKWLPATPPMQSTSTAGPVRKLAGAVVESSKEELKSTLKSVPGMIFRALVSRAIMAVVSYFGAMYLHAYITGFKNNGFRDDGGPWAPWLALTESKQGNSYAFIWGIAGMLLSSLVFTIFRRGPIKGIFGTLMAPFALIGRLKDGGKTGIGAIAIGAGVALLINQKLSVNPQANLSMGIGLLFIGAGRPGYYAARFLAGVIRRVTAPMQKKATARVPFDLKAAQLALFGVAPGFYLASRLPADKLVVSGIILTVIGLALVFNLKKPQPTAGTAVTLLFYGIFGSVAFVLFEWFTIQHAHADDGGRDEFTGNPDDYWKTEGGKLLDHGKPAADASAAGSVLGGDITQPPDPPPPPYSFSLCLDTYAMTITQSGPQGVRAWVVVSGPDADVCANLEAQLNSTISMTITGNITEWFSPTVEADAGGARCNFFVQIPDDPDQRKGPHMASVSASVSCPRGLLSRRCRINMEIQSDYILVLSDELKVKANEPGSAYYAYVQCNDPNLEGDAQLERSRQVAPGIKFNLTGAQANWIGGPGEVEGYISGDGKEIAVNPTVPAEDVTATPPFEVAVEVSCEVPDAGMLTKGGRIVIEPPDWFVELEPLKDKMMLDFKDAASFKVRLIPLDSSKLELYTGSSGNLLNSHLSISAEGNNAQYAVFTEKDGDGDWRIFDVTFSQAASGAQVDPYLDVVADAELTGRKVSQKFRINLAGKPSLEVTEKTVGIRSGGDPVDVHCKVKDGGDFQWSLKIDITGMDEVAPTGPPDEEDGPGFTLHLKAAAAEGTDVRIRTGKLILSATSTYPETNEEIATDPVEVELKLGQVGLTVIPTTIRLPLDPAKEPATFFKVRVVQFDSETSTFSINAGAMKGLEVGEWQEGDFTDGQNAFIGSGAEVKYERTEGSGLDAVAVWSVKQKLQVPASQAIDAVCTLSAPGDWGEDSDLFEVDQTFILPVDPASVESAKIRLEQANCRKVLTYMPEGELRQKFLETVETKAQALGAEGLFHLRHEIWNAAQDALLKEAESYLASAAYYGRLEQVADWTAYLAGLILQGMSSVLVPFPGDMVVNMLYQAIPDLANAVYQGGPSAAKTWFKQWCDGIVAGAGGMAVDMAIGQVVDLEKLFLRGMAQYKDPRKAGLIASVIFLEARFARYQITTKPDGEPYSLKESILNSLRDLAEQIVTCGISKGTKYANEGPGHGYDPKDGRHYHDGDGPPDTRGMPDANVKKMQQIAKDNNVEIYVRPTNPASKKILEEGGHPKPESIKTKTINEDDLKLGRKPEDIGKVGYFDPGPEPPPKGNMSDADHAKLVERYKQRKQEFTDNAKDMKKLHDKGVEVTPDGVVVAKDGKPYTGDHDIFDIRGPNGEKLTKAQYDKVMDELMKPPFSAQHGGHRQWDYSKLDKNTPPPQKDSNGKWVQPQSKFNKAKKIDEKILDSHQATTSSGGKGEGLIKVDGKGNLKNQNFDAHSQTLDKTGRLTQSATASGRHTQQEQEDK